MEIKITTRQILIILQVISWIIFCGLLVEAGAIIVNTFITLFINPKGVENFWEAKDYLPALYKYNQSHFVVIAVIMIIVAVLKSIMFYIIVKLFSKNQLDMSQPFSSGLRQFMLKLSYLSLGIGIFSQSGYDFASGLSRQGFKSADMRELHIDGASVWLFLTVILFVIVQIVKRGIEIQKENDLTI